MKKNKLGFMNQYNKAFGIIRYINTMNKRLLTENIKADLLWEYEAKNQELFLIIKDWPKIIKENLKNLNE